MASIGRYRPLMTATSEYNDDEDDEVELDDSQPVVIGAEAEEAFVSLPALESFELSPTMPRFFFG